MSETMRSGAPSKLRTIYSGTATDKQPKRDIDSTPPAVSVPRDPARSGDGASRIRLGFELLKRGCRAEALAAALDAQAADPSEPAWLDALGTLFTHLEEPVLALPYFERALDQEPANLDFRYNLAMAQRMVGQLREAEANLDIVITARPADGEAQHARSNLRRQTTQANHLASLEQCMRLLQGKRAVLPASYALAKELEDLGEYHRAFEILHRASTAYRRTLSYDVATDLAVMDKLIQTHKPTILSQLQTSVANEECIFIIGLPRTGTTLVERILGSHREIYAAGELDAFPKAAVDAVAQSGATVSKLDFVDRLLGVNFRSLGEAYLAATRPRTGHTRRFTDKLPLNYLYAGAIHAAFPRAKFIAVHRDPMDSCYAMYKTLFAAAYPFTYDLADLGRYYLSWRRLMAHWRQTIGQQWLEVSYEELVSMPEIVSRRMVYHCGLQWDQGCLDFAAASGGVTTASAPQVRLPIHRDSVGNWKNFREQLRNLSDFLELNGVACH